MARESITDLVYQFLRSLVHASFRDGAISGLRDAFGLPPPDGESDANDGDGASVGQTAIEIRFAGRVAAQNLGSLGADRNPSSKESRKSLTGPDAAPKRKRGRPRKNAVDAEPPARSEEASS